MERIRILPLLSPPPETVALAISNLSVGCSVGEAPPGSAVPPAKPSAVFPFLRMVSALELVPVPAPGAPILLFPTTNIGSVSTQVSGEDGLEILYSLGPTTTSA